MAQPKTSGVYAIYSAINDRRYIGSAGNIRTRWTRHRCELRGGYHGNEHLQRAWDKHGEDAFEFSIVEECPQDQLLIREQYYLDLNFLTPDPYNMCREAGSRLGTTHTEEAKEKIRRANLGRKASPETIARMSESQKGRKHSEESKAKMSEARKGFVVSEETRERLRQAATGRKASDEARANMSASHKGNTNRLGHVTPPETRAKLSEALKGNTNCAGKVIPDETRAKISASLKAYWARKREEETKDVGPSVG